MAPVCEARHPNGTLIYTESPLTASEKNFIFPTVCIVRILSGTGVWQIGSERCAIRQGDYVFLSNIEPRRVVSADGALRIATFSFPSAQMSAMGASECLRVFYGRNPAFSHTLRAPELNEFFDAIQTEMTRSAPTACLAAAYAVTLLVHAARAYDRMQPGALCAEFRARGSAAAAISASAAYICDHLADSLSVAELAHRAGMSPGYYAKMFRKYASVSPADYIARNRIRLFQSIYGSGTCTVLDAALASGFASSSGFYKACRRICGATPTVRI